MVTYVDEQINTMVTDEDKQIDDTMVTYGNRSRIQWSPLTFYPNGVEQIENKMVTYGDK